MIAVGRRTGADGLNSLGNPRFFCAHGSIAPYRDTAQRNAQVAAPDSRKNAMKAVMAA